MLAGIRSVSVLGFGIALFACGEAGSPGAPATSATPAQPIQPAPAVSARPSDAAPAPPSMSAPAPQANTPSGTAGAASAPVANPLPAGAAAPALPATPEPSAADDTPNPSAGCMGGTITPGRTTGSIQSQGLMRTYIRYVPASYDGKTPVPLVVDFHGATVDATSAENGSGLKPLADTEGYIYLAPNGIDNAWAAEDDSDELFVRDLVKELEDAACIDRRRIYATGCSNGAFLAVWLACNAEDVFVAAAPMCGTSFIDTATQCSPSRPVSMMLFLGETDPLACWEGERSDVLAMTPCARKFQKDFVKINECTGEIQSTHDGVCETVGECKGNTEVVICKTNTGHAVYGAGNIEIARSTWDFFERFRMPL